MAKSNLTKQADISIQVRSIDFVTRFAKNWDALKQILGITRMIRKTPGTQLISYTTGVTLQSGSVGEGEEIPYSKATVTEAVKSDITVEKWAKAVSIEAVNKYGAAAAVDKTDEEFLNQLQGNVLSKFYTFLNGGTLTRAETTFQMGLAMARGLVLDKFASIDRSVTDVVGFCNILDVYKYIGAAELTVQTQFGISYVKNFMGYSTLFLLPEKYIARGKIVALPVENIDCYYIDPADSDFVKLGLDYTTDGETNLIGFHANGNYTTAVGESFAIIGMTLWAEYIDGIAVVTVGGSMTTITGTSTDGTTSGTKLTITSPTTIPADWTLYIKAQASTAPTAPDYGTTVPSGWTKTTFTNGVADNVGDLTNGHKLTIIAANASNQVVAASGEITVDNA